MEIEHYQTLISNLPVRQQSFATKRSTWQAAEKEVGWLRNLNDKIFDGQETLNTSRQDIFNIGGSITELILKTIYWGYTAGMRGKHFVRILSKIQELEAILIQLKAKNNLTVADFDSLKESFKKIPGLGLSTYSKLLYFLNIKFNDSPCLILDQRLINVFNSKFYHQYDELGTIYDHNKEDKYLPYLEITNRISFNLNTRGENIEQFLFIFSNNLKPINIL